MSRETVLSRVRAALARKTGGSVPPSPTWPLQAGTLDVSARADLFASRLEALNGKVRRVRSEQEAGTAVAEILAGRSAIASNTPFLDACGVSALPGVLWGVTDAAEWRDACARVDAGITGASYALADTGTLVMTASASEPRLASLLPPIHVAVISAGSILSGLDELFLKVPEPAKLSSSMVLITGPSRTADIEQILVRGVHGPGEIHVVIVEA